MTNNPNNIRLAACRVRWGGRDLGLTKGGVDVTLKTDTKAVTVDQFGQASVNEFIVGRQIHVKCPFAETDLDTLYAITKNSGATLTDNGVTATGTVTMASVPIANDTLVVNGHTFTFVPSGTALDTVVIGATPAVTIANLIAVLGLSTDPNVQAALYTVGSATTMTISYYRSGVIGNTFTIAKTGSVLTVSAATLAGGTDATIRNVVLSTSIGTSMYSIALPLVLHPANMADNDATDDLTIPLAGQSGSISFAYKIDNERVYMVEFTGYPNPSTKVLCKFGA